MRRRKKLLFSLVSSVLAFSVLEVAARITLWIHDPFLIRMNQFTMSDPVMHHTWIPSKSGVDKIEMTPYVLHINRQSWVEECDVQRRKPPGVFRIFMVGDSNTQGFVEPSAKWVKIVERELNKRAAQGGGKSRTYEVINAGRASYSPLLYYLHIKNQILPYAPDLVVINVDMTDCVNDATYRLTMRTNGMGEVVGVAPSRTVLEEQGLVMTPRGVRKPTPWEKRSQWLIEHSACLAYLHLAMINLADQLPELRYFRDTASAALTAEATYQLPGHIHADWLAQMWSREIEDSVEFSMKMVGKSIDLLKSNGVGCIVVGVPHYPQFTGAWSTRPHEVLAETARRHGVPFLNLYEAFYPRIAKSKRSDYYWEKDPTHFNARGNQLWADAFVAFWEKEKTNFIVGANR